MAVPSLVGVQGNCRLGFSLQGAGVSSSFPALVDLRRQANVLSDVFAYGLGIAGLSVEHTPREFTISSVTGTYFTTLGLKPAAGRFFMPGEGEDSGDEAVVVLGYSSPIIVMAH
jgi:hypothetical protein